MPDTTFVLRADLFHEIVRAGEKTILMINRDHLTQVLAKNDLPRRSRAVSHSPYVEVAV
jgi:hypothetical protein